MAYYVLVAVARIDRRFENLDLLMSKDSTFHAAYKLFGFAREHRATDDLYTSVAAHLSC